MALTRSQIQDKINTLTRQKNNYTNERNKYKDSLNYANKLVRNFIPCYKKLDNVAGFYEMVNGVFYRNVGTGEFVVEENVDSGLESSDNLINKRTQLMQEMNISAFDKKGEE